LNSRGLVLVTGGSGHLGSRLLRPLGERGWRRRCLVHARAVGEAEEETTGDLADLSSLRKAVDGVTAIVHLAAVTHSRSPRQYEEVNVRGTANLLKASRAAGVRRFLFVSTRAIALEGGAYSRSKHRAERVVRKSALEWTIVRLPELYGAGSREGVDRVIARARYSRFVPIVGHGGDLLCPLHIDDVVRACVGALESPKTIEQTYTLAGPCLTMREFVQTAGEIFGRRPHVVAVPVPAVTALAKLSRVIPLPLYPDQLARLRSPKSPPTPGAEVDLCFRPRPLRIGLAETVPPFDDGKRESH
jgi:nucleoside-diphosphate-sugar epimerase